MKNHCMGFLRAFWVTLAIGVPIAFCTWTACCTTWSASTRQLTVKLQPSACLVPS